MQKSFFPVQGALVFLLRAVGAYAVKYAAVAFEAEAVAFGQMLFNIAHETALKMHKLSAGDAFNVYVLAAVAFFVNQPVNRFPCFLSRKFKQALFGAQLVEIAVYRRPVYPHAVLYQIIRNVSGAYGGVLPFFQKIKYIFSCFCIVILSFGHISSPPGN